MASAEAVVRTYLKALKDPSSLTDEDAIAQKESELASAEDPIDRLRVQEELQRLASPSVEAVEDEFVVHGKAWADEMGISAQAFVAEGVPTAVLRRAGFPVAGGGRGGRRRSSSSTRRQSSGKRVTTEEVVEAMPSEAFTAKTLREVSGASPAVVRKAIAQELEAGRLVDAGTDPDHSGPGRAPVLYRKGGK